MDSVMGGKWWLQLRYRYENVDEDGFSKQARASTLRTVLGYETAPLSGFSALIEFEDVSVIGNDLYNDTLNGVTDRPVVADPDGTEINQSYLKFENDDWLAKLGRQRIVLGNHRFVGDVGWRQNEQTFDAFSVAVDAPGEIEGFYAYVHNVNRVFGDNSPMGDHSMDSHLLNVSREFAPVGKVTGYVYYLDYDTVTTLSSTSVGARLQGSAEVSADSSVTWTAEYAHQVDAADNPDDVSADYIHAVVGGQMDWFSARVGLEILEGAGSADPANNFKTPLATGHRFNGWADKFLTTPASGLQDLYVAVTAEHGKAGLTVVYHDFQAEQGSSDYGSEFDIVATYSIEHGMLGVKYANYMSDTFATDTQKLWLWVSFDF